jgi:homoserine kinase
MGKEVRAFAPATVANVACGFDVLGFAVEQPGDEVMVACNDRNIVEVLSITGDDGKLPLLAEKNTAAVAVIALLKHLGRNDGFSVRIKKMMPLGSGLGSSAASAAAALVAANELLGNLLTREELVPFAMEAERIACGAAHADNVAPALLGGFVLVRSYEPLDVIKIEAPHGLYCAIVHPQIELRTEDARKVLKQEITLKDAIRQWGNLGGLIAGLMRSDYGLIGRSLQDVVAEPIRGLLIPGFDEVKQAALQSGVLGCSISGSGPSVFSLSTSLQIAEKAGLAMQQALQHIGLGSEVYVSKVNSRGAYIIQE